MYRVWGRERGDEGWGMDGWMEGGGGREEIRREEAARSGLMARIKHPADVFSGAWSVESRS